jgi:formate dehydrogenase major subunit
MSVGEFEIEAMEAEGIEFLFLVSPLAIESEGGQVTGIRLIRNAIEKDGRLKTIPGSEFIIKADTVVLAIGQREEFALFGEKEVQPDGNFFMAGDFRNGASTVIEAAADGRKIARQVHQLLSGIKGYQDIIKITEADKTGRERDYDFISRQPMDEIPLHERREKNREVDIGFSREKSLIEARRCYLCHYNFQIDIDRCIYCLRCIDVMPVDCIMMAKEIRILEDGNIDYIKTERWDEVQAITIDNDKCIRCGNCYRACPVKCITLSKYELQVEELGA